MGLSVLSSRHRSTQDNLIVLKDQLVGSWTLSLAIDTRPGGMAPSDDTLGSQSQGHIDFDANGRYVQIISRSDHPELAANKADMGTADENKAVMTGMVVSFGTCTVNEADKTLITRIEGGMYPNIVGNDAKQIITSLTADELKYTNPATTTGSNAAAQWKRVESSHCFGLNGSISSNNPGAVRHLRHAFAPTNREEYVMNTNFKFALALVAGTALGAAAMQGLHAQTKPELLISETVVLDPAAKPRCPACPCCPQAAGCSRRGHPSGGRIAAIDGAAAPRRVGINEWDSLEQAQAFLPPSLQGPCAARDKAVKTTRRS